MNEACIVIPARYQSSRFPGKPLQKILNKEMILWVLEASSKAVGKNHVYVATDDNRIAEIVCKNNYKSIMTSPHHLTGTDRIAEAVKKLNYQVIINVQGDEPLVNPIDIKNCIKKKITFPNKVINGYSFLNKEEDPNNINIPKVVTNEKEELIYMSRKAIPGSKDLKNSPLKYKKQVCIYGFNKDELYNFKKYGKSSLEHHEDIEILRFLEINRKVLMFQCMHPSIAVDIPQDIDKVESWLKEIK